MTSSLVLLAAGVGSRFGGAKQLTAVGPSGETLMDYAVYDALRSGFGRLVVVTRLDLETLLRQWGSRLPIEVGVAVQRLDHLPAGRRLPPGRTAPWGTAHAILAAAAELPGPFGVINADDLYGAMAFSRMADHLRGCETRDENRWAVVGFRLRDTLSPHGGVSRAVCEVDRRGELGRVTEVLDLTETDGVIAGRVNGMLARFIGDEVVSRNFWGFTPAVLPLLERGLATFLERHGDSPTAEYRIPDAVNDLIAAGAARVRVLPAEGPAVGVTHAADLEGVRSTIGRLVEAGAYPRTLFPRS